jgi:hypothetical protein
LKKNKLVDLQSVIPESFLLRKLILETDWFGISFRKRKVPRRTEVKVKLAMNHAAFNSTERLKKEAKKNLKALFFIKISFD